jgi:PAS domain S-box-containing protein
MQTFNEQTGKSENVIGNPKELADMFNQSVVPICITNHRGEFVQVNEAFCNLFECEASDLIGRSYIDVHFQDLEPNAKLELLEEATKIFASNATFHREISMKSLKGKELIVEVILKKILVNEKPHVSVYLIDQTEKRDFQKRIIEQNKKLKEFAFLTSHKLRQPLANIMGLIELVKNESQSQKDVTITFETIKMLTSQLDGVVHEMNNAINKLDIEVEKSLFLERNDEIRIQDVWIVDDDQVIGYITKKMLLNADPSLKITEFLSSKMALEKLRLDHKAPDILLLDINMPGFDGFDFLDALNEMNCFVNVYMYSSSIDPYDVKRASSYPMVRDFLSKPVDGETVRRLLDIQTYQRRQVS